MSEKDFSVDTYLHEKQMSMLDALDESLLKPKRERKPNAPKEPKPKTWEVSFALYQRGLKPEDIAIERSLSLGTIFSHLSRYLDSGQVSLDSLVSEEHQQIIKRVISKVGIIEGATAIKNFCPPEITYDEIRLMMTHNLSEK